MDNLKKYKEVFINTFNVNEDEVEQLHYKELDKWNSADHLILISNLEDAFGIRMEFEDIVAFTSFKEGIKVLEKYKIKMK